MKEPLEEWSNETVETVVKTFIDEKFPTVFALNKIDHPGATNAFNVIDGYITHHLPSHIAHGAIPVQS